MSTTVRAATREDIPWLCAELRDFAQFVGTRHSLFPDVEECVQTLATLIEEHPMFVATVDGVSVGFIGGMLTRHPMNSRLIVLTELFWWVAPPYRGGRAGLLLLRAFQAFGLAHAHQIVMTLEEKSPVKRETLERFGFQIHEHTYLQEV